MRPMGCLVVYFWKYKKPQAILSGLNEAEFEKKIVIKSTVCRIYLYTMTRQ
jgi:hypothetical protein